MRLALVALLGAAGACSRYAIGVAAKGQTFPWSTLAVNVAGCLALGTVLAVGQSRWDDDVVIGVSIGFLGAFTTFSTFGYETQALLRDDRLGAAAAYVVLSVLVGVAAAAAGYGAGRALVR